MKKFLITSAFAFATLAFLGAGQLSACDKGATGKCGNTTKPMKCGAGKCGDAMQKPKAKCGAGKCGATEKPKAATKCGAGKCGGGK